MRRILSLLTWVWLGSLTAGCVSSRPALQERPVAQPQAVLVAPETAPPPWPVLPVLPSADKRLYLTSQPDGAEVFIDQRFMGLTPLTLSDYPFGTYFMEVRKPGYRTFQLWLEYKDNQEEYYWTLERETGTLDLTVQPDGAVAYIAGRSLAPGKNLLPAGAYTITVSAFGFVPIRRRTVIQPNEVTPLSITLETAPFAITDLTLSRSVINPHRTGPAASTACSFNVSGPGSGSITVRDGAGHDVARLESLSFSQSRQCVVWNGLNDAGRPVADGVYRLMIAGMGRDEDSPRSAAVEVTIDSSLSLEHQNLWSGAAGLYYAPAPEIPPTGSLGLSGAALAGLELQPDWSAPLVLGGRIGLGGGHEVDVSAGALLSDSYPAALFASASWKFQFLSPSGGDGLSAALLTKLSYQYEVYGDLLSNPTGLVIAVPARLSLGPFSLFASLDVCLSPFKITADRSSAAAEGFWLWLYGRAGLSFSAGIFSAGVSAVFRSTPFDEGLALALPVPTAVEITLYLPDSPVYLTLAGVVEWGAATPRAWAGGGFGLLW